MQFEFFQYFMNSGLSRDELLAIFFVSFSVFLLFTHWKIQIKEMIKNEADANEKNVKKETVKTDEDKRKHP